MTPYIRRIDQETFVSQQLNLKVQVYSSISIISSDFYIFTPWSLPFVPKNDVKQCFTTTTPWSLDLFIRVPSQLVFPWKSSEAFEG